MSKRKITIGEVIRKGRKEKQLSLRQIDDKINIPWSNLCLLEKGMYGNPTFKTVYKICKFFKIDISTIKP